MKRGADALRGGVLEAVSHEVFRLSGASRARLLQAWAAFWMSPAPVAMRATVWRLAASAKPAVAVGLVGQAAVARAGLPEVVTPDDVDEGDFVGLLQSYALDVIVFGGLGITAIAFLIVAKNVLGKYSDVGAGRATWGEVGAQAAVGVVLLVLVVYLMTEASGVLDD